MKISSEELITAIDLLSLVPSRAGVPSSEFIRLHCSKDIMNAALSAEVFGVTNSPLFEIDTEEWTAFVDRASFCPFVAVSKELKSTAPFELSWNSKKKSLLVRCGNRKGVFNEVTNVSGYSDASKVVGTKLKLSDTIKKTLVLAAKYATPDPTIANLNCVYVQNNGWVLASNERSALRIHDKSVTATIPLPLGLLAAVQDSTVSSIIVGKGLAKVTLPKGYLCQTINQAAASKFPAKAIHAAIDSAKTYPKSFSVDASKLVAALDRLNLYSALVIKRDAVVTLVGTTGAKNIQVVCKVPQGRFEERLQAKVPIKADFKIEWLLQLLLPLSAIAKDIGEVSVHFEPNKTTPYYLHAKGMGLELLVSRKGK